MPCARSLFNQNAYIHNKTSSLYFPSRSLPVAASSATRKVSKLETVKNLQHGTVYKLDSGENIYVKRNISPERHYMRKMKAYGIQETDALLMSRYRVTKIVLCINDRGTFAVDYKTFMQDAKRANFGHGDQLFLAENNRAWKKYKLEE